MVAYSSTDCFVTVSLQFSLNVPSGLLGSKLSNCGDSAVADGKILAQVEHNVERPPDLS